MIDINSYDVGQLHLNAVKLKEIQRRKTEEDERQMRQFLCEGDLVVAEVQQISN
jgi:exosome complex RNA-binding protein Rrp4